LDLFKLEFFVIVLFWLFLFSASYSYFVYPVLLALLPRFIRSPENQCAVDSAVSSATLIITAYNEAARIREKIENSLAIMCQDFSLEIIVASDCSDDETDEIVNSYRDLGVKLVRADQRLGKENAQLCAIKQAKGEILIFSDTATQIPEDALGILMNYFKDSSVGAISSEDRFISKDGQVAGEGAYVKYEMWLRKKESELCGLVGLSGSFFAARKSICDTWDISSPSDFNTALNCAKKGLKAVTAPDVLGYYQDIQDSDKEYQRKVRTVLRGISALSRHYQIMNPFQYGLFAFEVFSHKLMRWLVPWFLLLLLTVNFLLYSHHWVFLLALIFQIVFYGVAAFAHFSNRVKENVVARIIYFFVQVNLAIADATVQFIKGNRMTVWQPSAR
jgi:cellulose synthase/poly-beta-1,6-N-acetylglucosamine synthase-like glycosyltransferase